MGEKPTNITLRAIIKPMARIYGRSRIPVLPVLYCTAFSFNWFEKGALLEHAYNDSR
jgi:hypothetical protein